MKIFHVALASDWSSARELGSYRVSTLGRSLAEEGFIHAARADQWQDVRRRFYGEVTEPLVLLVIDTDLLDAPVVDEPASDAGAAAGPEETFPHIYGAVDVAAVVRAMPLTSPGATPVTGPARAAPAAAAAPRTPSTPSARDSDAPADGTAATGDTRRAADRPTFWQLFARGIILRAVVILLFLGMVIIGGMVGMLVDESRGTGIGLAVGLVVGIAAGWGILRIAARKDWVGYDR